MPVPTPHIEAAAGDFADTVLMPGDPLRARHIADNFLENARQVNGVRDMLGFTGDYMGREVSVMGSGMGIPSISIYAHELFAEYEVESIIRVGSCGAVNRAIKIRDVVIGTGASTDSGINRARFGGYDFAAIADFGLAKNAVAAAAALGIEARTGNLFFRRPVLHATAGDVRCHGKDGHSRGGNGSRRPVRLRGRTWKKGARDLHCLRPDPHWRINDVGGAPDFLRRHDPHHSGVITAVIETLADLIRIDSVNPEWSGPGEARVADYIRDYFATESVETIEREVLPGRRNVIARLPGRDPSRRIVFEAHMDTVSVNSMTIPPFDPKIENGKMFGRGSCDVKSGLATMMHALRDVSRSGKTPLCEVWLAAVVDEEHAYHGVLDLIDQLREDGVQTCAAVVAEPTECRVVRANKGVLRWHIETRGVTAHSSCPRPG